VQRAADLGDFRRCHGGCSPALPSSLDVPLRPARTLELIGATNRQTSASRSSPGCGRAAPAAPQPQPRGPQLVGDDAPWHRTGTVSPRSAPATAGPRRRTARSAG
jgi:hypothetical protein